MGKGTRGLLDRYRESFRRASAGGRSPFAALLALPALAVAILLWIGVVARIAGALS